jgi:hypothetical protein
MHMTWDQRRTWGASRLAMLKDTCPSPLLLCASMFVCTTTYTRARAHTFDCPFI